MNQISPWALRVATYMEVLEQKLVAEQYMKDGTLTTFPGFPFGAKHPYNYFEAKRVLRLAMEELRSRKRQMRELGLDPEGEGRTAIRGRESALGVWDFLWLRKAKSAKQFTHFPHCTLSVQPERVVAIVTIPNSIRTRFRNHLLGDTVEEFAAVLREVLVLYTRSLGRLRGVRPWVEVLQRHYASQSAVPTGDASLEFDLRTAFSNGKHGVTKFQPQWLQAVNDVLSKKRSNVQLAVGAAFYFDECADVRTPKILDHILATWSCCKPLIEAATVEKYD